jgi:hypothetical protein
MGWALASLVVRITALTKQFRETDPALTPHTLERRCFCHTVIGSPGRSSRTSPSVRPQSARLFAGMVPITSITARFPASRLDSFLGLCIVAYCDEKPLLDSRLFRYMMLGQEPNHAPIGLLLHDTITSVQFDVSLLDLSSVLLRRLDFGPVTAPRSFSL